MVKSSLIAALCIIFAAPALAQDEERLEPPQVYNDMIACRAIADDAARLACFDERVGALQQAADSEQVVVVDRGEIREAERGLFGLRLPRIRLFDSSEENRINQIESTIAEVAGGVRGSPLRFSLEDGSIWAQTDSVRTSRLPRRGHPVIIRRAALGSFRAEIDGMQLIRVERIR